MLAFLEKYSDIIPFFVVILIFTAKYFVDYSDKADRLFGQMRARKDAKMQANVSAVIDPLIDELREHDKAQMRIEMLTIYNTYKKKKEIPSEVYESYCEIYKQYKDLGGNHYIDRIDPEIRRWRIK